VAFCEDGEQFNVESGACVDKDAALCQWQREVYGSQDKPADDANVEDQAAPGMYSTLHKNRTLGCCSTFRHND
jgi:hypothetical protein